MTHIAPANSIVIASSDGYTSHLFSIEPSLETMLYYFLVRDGNELQWNINKSKQQYLKNAHMKLLASKCR